jgi:isopentenyl-diphosphate delta-isomerase type 1
MISKMKTTDPQDEIFPIVNENDEVIGKITRKEAHKSPQITHRASIILVFDKQGGFLIQKRSLTKDTSPGCWSCSVGGHVDYGEKYLDVAVRETKEELGINVNSENFQVLGKMITISPQEKEMTTVFKVSLKETPELHTNPLEVIETRFVTIDLLREMIQTGRWTPSSLQVINKFILKK